MKKSSMVLFLFGYILNSWGCPELIDLSKWKKGERARKVFPALRLNPDRPAEKESPTPFELFKDKMAQLSEKAQQPQGLYRYIVERLPNPQLRFTFYLSHSRSRSPFSKSFVEGLREIEDLVVFADPRHETQTLKKPRVLIVRFYGQQTLLRILDLAIRHSLILTPDHVQHGQKEFASDYLARATADLELLGFDREHDAAFIAYQMRGRVTHHHDYLVTDLRFSSEQSFQNFMESRLGSLFIDPSSRRGDQPFARVVFSSKEWDIFVSILLKERPQTFAIPNNAIFQQALNTFRFDQFQKEIQQLEEKKIRFIGNFLEQARGIIFSLRDTQPNFDPDRAEALDEVTFVKIEAKKGSSWHDRIAHRRSVMSGFKSWLDGLENKFGLKVEAENLAFPRSVYIETGPLGLLELPKLLAKDQKLGQVSFEAP